MNDMGGVEAVFKSGYAAGLEEERAKLAKWARDEASRQQSAAAAATKAKDPREADRCDCAAKALQAVAKRMGAK